MNGATCAIPYMQSTYSTRNPEAPTNVTRRSFLLDYRPPSTLTSKSACILLVVLVIVWWFYRKPPKTKLKFEVQKLRFVEENYNDMIDLMEAKFELAMELLNGEDHVHVLEGGMKRKGHGGEKPLREEGLKDCAGGYEWESTAALSLWRPA